MPATDTEKKLIRRKTGDSATSFGDGDVDLLFAAAESDYSGYSRKVWSQAVVVARVDELYTASIAEVTYQQNETRENLSDISKGLKAKLEREQAKLDDLIEGEKSPAVFIGTTRKVPKTIKKYPRS